MAEKAVVKKVPCEVYSRIVGYLRPVRNWNKAKRQEFEDRQVYDAGKAIERIDPTGQKG